MSFRHFAAAAAVLLSIINGLVVAETVKLETRASETCRKIALGKTIEVETFLQPTFLQEQTQYWSGTCSRLVPACHLIPKSAAEVSTIVQALLLNQETFAVKAGGHNPNKFYSSIDGGPLIQLKGLNEVTYDPNAGTVRVGPGNRWSAVAKALEPYNVTVVGGRIGHVGVGGYLVGGGLSYLSTQHGWAVDTVVQFEVVLANGTIVTASNTHNVDLFNVLRGGGNNFGIVTAYTMKAFPIGQIWGGQLIFGQDKTDDILKAVRNFTEFYPDDRAAIIATNQITLSSLVQIWTVFLFWQGEEPPPGTFDAIINIGPLINTVKKQSYYTFLSSLDALVISGSVYAIATEMTPLPNADVGHTVLKSYYDYYQSLAAENKLVPGLLAVMAIQPLPRRLAQKSKANGGDLIGLDENTDLLLLEFNYSYLFSQDDPKMDKAINRLFTGIKSRVNAFIANGTIADAYLPLFMNDANYQQDFWGRLKPATASYARSIRDTLDPTGFFRDRTAGFKL